MNRYDITKNHLQQLHDTDMTWSAAAEAIGVDRSTIGSFSKGHEYEFYHIPANTRHTAYAISYSQQKAVAQFSTTFVVNLVVHTTSYGKSNFLCFLACKN